jgi:hypothetical protein
MPPQTTAQRVLHVGFCLVVVLVMAACGSTATTTIHSDPPAHQQNVHTEREQQHREAVALAQTWKAEEAIKRQERNESMATISACDKNVLVRAPNGAPLKHCVASIERLGEDLEEGGASEAKLRASLARVDWMHPSVAAEGASATDAIGMVTDDFALVFAYTEAPPLPVAANGREPTCEGWQAGGEEDDAAYLARAGWPYHSLVLGLETMNEVCGNVEARGLIPALGYLLCLSAPTQAAYTGHLDVSQRREIILGLQCGENERPLHNQTREAPPESE